ncbi:hypothetical protein ACR78Z_17620 [Sphingobacterium thalpophilum]|uniref:Uncharacterized protein n=1 Tax=Sphingobacterium thalpophilum TaxID=259 RepID=A0A4U9VXP4_9SPHI|nr:MULTISPECIES: hypothetical protein [Sphingobacterium]MCW8311834.1 hypothetical protein [Sphingobacterium sp. InxBP1]VTR52445.1 Uncharacterised protein [Sphingobacterium thalpophilum]
MSFWKFVSGIVISGAFYISCHGGDGSDLERLRADSLVSEVIKGRLSLDSLAKSQEFMYFNEKYFHEPANLKEMSAFDRIQVQVVTYRIYSHVKLVKNRYQFGVKQAKDLHIPNRAFVYYQRSFEEMNRRAAASRDSVQLELPEDYAIMLLKQEL